MASQPTNEAPPMVEPNEKPDFGSLEKSVMTTPYTNFTQAELCKKYASSAWSHRFAEDHVVQEHIQVLQEGTQKAKSTLECHLNIAYGPSSLQKLDVYAPSTLPKAAPVFFYIHGGYWYLLGREYSGFIASNFTEAGAVVVAIGYDLGKVVTMDERVAQVKNALKWTLQFAHERGSEGVYISGHSAGGHLTAMMLSYDWSVESPEHHHLLKGAAPVSGLFDLRPFVFYVENQEVGMGMKMAWINSPVRLMENITKYNKHIQIVVAVGEHDSPEFRRQSKEFADALKDAGLRVSYIDMPERDHFNMIENLELPSYQLSKAIFTMMNLI